MAHGGKHSKREKVGGLFGRFAGKASFIILLGGSSVTVVPLQKRLYSWSPSSAQLFCSSSVLLVSPAFSQSPIPSISSPKKP